jgi:hypothetical protein
MVVRIMPMGVIVVSVGMIVVGVIVRLHASRIHARILKTSGPVTQSPQLSEGTVSAHIAGRARGWRDACAG